MFTVFWNRSNPDTSTHKHVSPSVFLYIYVKDIQKYKFIYVKTYLHAYIYIYMLLNSIEIDYDNTFCISHSRNPWQYDYIYLLNIVKHSAISFQMQYNWCNRSSCNFSNSKFNTETRNSRKFVISLNMCRMIYTFVNILNKEIYQMLNFAAYGVIIAFENT